jgi:Tfp pilus assembly protein PilN
MADAGGLQLLPETRKKIEISVPGQNRSLVFAFVFLLLIVALYFGLMAYKQGVLTSIAGVDSQLQDLEKSRDKAKESQLIDLSQQLAVINPLINGHLIWSAAMAKLQNLILPQVQIVTFNADSLGRKVSIKGLAANYTTVAKQIAAFYALDSVTDIILNKVSSQPTGLVEFTMQLTIDNSRFLVPGK